MTAIYIHIPYCKSKCPYCDFASVPVDESVDAYLRALAREVACVSEAIPPAETVYIGGGTPTVLTPKQICRLFERLRERLEISPLAEITIEANPCSLSATKARLLASNGVNRVSLGAQSFVDSELSFLGRSHGVEDVLHSFRWLREAGTDNVNLDLMYAIPIQSAESWRYSLAQAIDLKPEHISTYCLTFEPPTPLWQLSQGGKIERKTGEEEVEFSEIAREMLTNAGYEHYEISNFALPGRHSLHNSVYWSNEEYLGLGASAVSYIGSRRITNLREPAAYVRAVESRASAADEVEEIPPHMQAVETIIQRLRLRKGIDCTAFRARFGFHPEETFGDSLQGLVALGLLEDDGFTIKSSLEGWRLANEIALKLLA